MSYSSSVLTSSGGYSLEDSGEPSVAIVGVSSLRLGHVGLMVEQQIWP